MGARGFTTSPFKIHRRRSPRSTGSLTQEAEAGDLFGAFRIVEDSAARGGRYIGTPEGFSDQNRNAEHRADYCANISEAGTYTIRGRAQGMSQDSNAFSVAVDGLGGGPWDMWLSPNVRLHDAAKWLAWEQPYTFDLSAGEHTVTVDMQEGGTRLGKLEPSG